MVDGQQVGTWVNLGSLGSPGNLLQATGGIRPLFRAVATPGKINNLSALQSDGTQWMQSASFTNKPAPNTHAILFRPTDFAQQGDLFDGGTNRNILFWTAGTGALNLYAGGGVVGTGQTVAITTWELCVPTFNGATSWNRLNGAQSANLSPGTGDINRLSLWSDSVGTGSTVAKGMIAEHLTWNGSPPLATDIEAYFVSKYGVTPQ